MPFWNSSVLAAAPILLAAMAGLPAQAQDNSTCANRAAVSGITLESNGNGRYAIIVGVRNLTAGNLSMNMSLRNMPRSVLLFSPALAMITVNAGTALPIRVGMTTDGNLSGLTTGVDSASANIVLYSCR